MHRKDERKPLVEIKELDLCRGNFHMDQVSLTIYPHEILAIIGKNGSGKTLLLESIAGFHQIDEDCVWFQEKRLSDYVLHERNIGYLYQEYCLFPHMTARDNIAYGLKMQGCPKKMRTEKVEHIAKEFEIETILEQYPATLSGGEQQRVALARALVTEPKLLLLDEPFSALDPVTKQKLYKMIRKIHEEYGCAIVFVTHDFHEAESFADRIGILINGNLKGVVPAEELFEYPWDVEVRQFLGMEN